MVAGSLDRTVRLWDLSAGLPVCSSAQHGGTVRCLALGATALASGASDSIVRVWEAHQPASELGLGRGLGRGRSSGFQAHDGSGADLDDLDLELACMDLHGDASSDSERDDEGSGSARSTPPPPSPTPLFDVSRPPMMLRGHTGPVSCMCLTETASVRAGIYDGDGQPSLAATARQRTRALRSGLHGPQLAGERAALYSGSWDCTVRLWEPSNGASGGGGSEEDEAGGWACSDVLR